MAGKPVLVPHSVSDEEALRRLGRLLAGPEPAEYLGALCFERVGCGYRFTGKVQGVKVTGDMGVQDGVVRVNYKLPLAAQPLRRMADRYIHDYLREMLS